MNDSHYYSNYAATRDIDCFFRIGDVAYHFASNGQPIPNFITRKRNTAIQNLVYEMIPNARGRVTIHEDAIKELIRRELVNNEDLANANINQEELRINDAMIEEYATSFIEMAKCGFVSMDLDEIGHYYKIAEPTDQQVAYRVIELLPEVDQEFLRQII